MRETARRFVQKGGVVLRGLVCLAVAAEVAVAEQVPEVEPQPDISPDRVEPGHAPDPFEPVLAPPHLAQDWLETTLGLSMELGYTLVYQHATHTRQPPRDLLAGRYEIVGEWALLDHSRLGRGTLGFAAQGMHGLTRSSDTDLADSIGSAFGVDENRDDIRIAVTELWWSQASPDDQLALTLGKIDQAAFFDTSRIANDETTQFLASPLVNNPAIPFPDEGLGANLLLSPSGANWYATAGFGDASAVATHTGFRTFDDAAFFAAAEAGLNIAPADLGEGTYRATLWRNHIDGERGWGVAFSFDQAIGGHLVPFARYGIGDRRVTEFRQFASLGLGIENPLGRAGELAAVGVAWGEPSDRDLREQTLVELFYRVQVTETLAVTPDVQMIFNPADWPERNTVGVLGVRVQAAF